MKTTNQNSLALLTAIACWGIPQAYAAPSISVEVLDSSIVQGETFDVQVWARTARVSGEELIGFAFHATNPPVATCTGFDSGPLFTPVAKTNTVVTDLAFPGIDTNDVLLATLHFTADTVGSGPLTVQGTYDGLEYGLFYLDSGFDITGSVQVTVRPPPAVVYVDDDYSAGNSGGHEWGYDAFAAIQPGVNILANGGTIHVANGTYAGNVTMTKAATLAAGSSPGQVTVNGDLTLSSDTTLAIELAGASPGSGFDQWVVTGNANLAGTLTVALANDFYPAANARFAFVTAAARAGTFAGFYYPSNDVGLLEDYTSSAAAVQVLNVRPELPVITDRTVDEAALLSLMANATDADTPSQTLTYALTNAPDGATVSAIGEITWTPTEAQGPMSTNLTVCVTDSGTPKLTVSRTFQVVVNEINLPPLLGMLADLSVDPGQTLSFTATATDSDLPANVLTFSLVEPPAGAVIDAGSGLFTWRPGVGLADTTNTIHVRVADDGSPALSGTNSFLAIVNPLSAPVVLNPISWSDGTFTLSVTGPTGPDYIIQSSSDMTAWTSLFTNTSGTIPFGFTDTNAGSGCRFYRVLLGP